MIDQEHEVEEQREGDLSEYEHVPDGEGVDDDEHAGEEFDAPRLEVKALAKLLEQGRRSKVVWLCKELPRHKHGTLVRIMNA